MVTLAGFQGSSVVADLTAGNRVLREAFGTKRQRDAKKKKDKDLKEINCILFPETCQDTTSPDIAPGETDPGQGTRSSRLDALSPPAAQMLDQVLKSGDEAAQQEFRGEAVKGAALATELQGLPEAAQRQRLTQEAQRMARQGEPVDRIVELLNAPNLGIELQKMQIIAEDITNSIPEARRGLLSTPEKQAAFTRLSFANPSAARVLLSAEQQRVELARGPEMFEEVFDEEGNVVAQRSTKTGKVIKTPLAKGGGIAAKGTFAKGPPVIVRLPDDTFAQSVLTMDTRTNAVTERVVPITGQPVTRIGETGQEQSLRAIGQAGGVTRAKAQETRQQGIINEGLTAADNIPILNRSIELLNSVETGGFAAASLRAKQIFGIESADEAELSASLGKAVLSQLRGTFGAQFTEGEGARLERIEAAFGKSPAGNRRLLRQTKRFMERVANRAIRSAEKTGDTDTADEIRDAMAFSLDVGGTPAQAAPVTPEVAPTVTPQEGQTATNPATGERRIFKDGSWQVL